MPHCTKCGAEVPATAQFCPTCGQPQPASPGAPPAANWQAAPAAQSGMSENAAACLSYAFGWITGIIFFLIDRRPYVRFHAAQSIVTFGCLHIIHMIVTMIFGVGFLFGGLTRGYGHWGYGGWGSLGAGIVVLHLFNLLILVLWIVCMIKAGSGQRFVLPLSGPVAESLSAQ